MRRLRCGETMSDSAAAAQHVEYKRPTGKPGVLPRRLQIPLAVSMAWTIAATAAPWPHIPHGWDAGVLYEESTGTLLCGDLFTQLGDGPALTDVDIVGPAIAAEDLFKYSSLNPGMGMTIRRLAEFAPRTLALMHGPSF